MQDLMGERFKSYEACYDFRIPDRIPVILRLDGRAFSGLTRRLKLERPLDEGFHRAMIKTMIALCGNIQNARFGYTQSDEISILIYPKYINSSAWFDNRVVKMATAAASLASVHFNHALLDTLSKTRGWPETFLEIAKACPTFDARVFVVPVHDVCNAFLWRQKDASRNSVGMHCEFYFARKDVEGMGTKDRVNKLMQAISLDWHALPPWKKWGTGTMRRTFEETILRPGNPEPQTVTRSRWEPVVLPDLRDDPGFINQFLADPTIRAEEEKVSEFSEA